MVSALLQVHSILRWVILILLLLSVTQCLIGWIKHRELREADVKLWLFTMISAHTTLLIGLILLFFGRLGILSSGLPEGVNLMQDKFYRFFWIEHPIGMLVATLLITLGRGQVKKQITATVPWPGREIVGRGL
jgi:hypothetical protein